MTKGHEHHTCAGSWQIRQIQAVDTDPMFSGVEYTFSVESDELGFEVQVTFAPIFYHLASLRHRVRLPETARGLVTRLLDHGVATAASIHVGSDGVAKHAGRVLAKLLPLHRGR